MPWGGAYFLLAFRVHYAIIAAFPERLEHILTGPGTGVKKVECVVFPAYEVRPIQTPLQRSTSIQTDSYLT